MPRKGKGLKPPKNMNLHSAKARFWTDRIRAGLKAREDYDEIARDVESYFKADHKKTFEDQRIRESFMDMENVVAVSVPKVAQARNALGPHLYPVNPKRTVTAKTDDMVMVGLARVLQEYLNYTPEESGYVREARRGIDDSLLRGRGLLQTYFNETLGIVTSKRVKSIDLVVDPDSESMKDAEWIAIRRFCPLFRLKREARNKDLWRLKGLDREPTKRSSASEFHEPITADNQGIGDTYRPTNRMIEVYTVFSKMGSGVRGLDFDGSEKSKTPNDGNDWVQLEIVLDHEFPLSERDWEIPLYLDEAWPVVELDLVETLDELWPVSLMGQVLGLQRAMDLLTTVQLSSCKQRGRVLVFGDASLSEHNQQLIRSGPETCFIPVQLQQGERLNERYHVVNMGTISQELRLERDYYEREIEETTGVTKTITGSPSQGSQERSATATQLRSQATSVRLSDMKGRVEEWSARAARQEAIYACLDLDAEDISRYVRTSKINLLFVRIEVAGGAVVPLRDVRTEKEREQDEATGSAPLTMQDLYPMASTFYENDEAGFQEAAQAVMAIQEVLTDPGAHPKAAQIMELAASLEPADENGVSPSIQVSSVTVEDVLRETADLTAQDHMREFGYGLATGSMAITDNARLQDLSETMIGQVLPVALQTGNFEVVNAIFRNYERVNEVPDEMRLPDFVPPAPPPGAAPPQ